MPDPMLERLELLGRDEVTLADENLIGKTNLPPCLLPVVQLRLRMLGIDQGDDGIEQKLLGDFLVHKKSLGHRARVGQARGLHHHPVKVQQTLAALGPKQLQGGAQVLTDGATDTAIAHLHNGLLGIAHQNFVIDVFFSKLVLDDGDLAAVGLGQHTLEQRRLARA